MALLDIRGLELSFPGRAGPVTVLDGVDWRVEAEESVALVGESGCGKTLLALSALDLVPPGASLRWRSFRVASGGAGRTMASRSDLHELRGRQVAMVFQEPGSALHPTWSVGRQLTETLLLRQGLRRAEASRRAVELLERVGIEDPGRRAQDPPHRFSGGMQQRVGIALALACRPRLLIADEPTTALDVTTQAGIVALLRDLQREQGLALWWITHDLDLAGVVAERLAVMYAGRLVEEGSTQAVLAHPQHPYTRGLLDSTPRQRGVLPEGIPGTPPEPGAWPVGCRFHPRCERADATCEQSPAMEGPDPSHAAACHHPLGRDLP